MTAGDKIKLRAELAGKCAAAIVSTITNDYDYQRLSLLATYNGLNFSGWIARDAVKQADALMKELGLNGE